MNRNSKWDRQGKASHLTIILLLLGVIGSTAGEARVKTVRVAGVSKVVKARTGADGTIHLLFDADDGPGYVVSKDAGKTFSAPLGIMDAASKKPGLVFHGEDLAIGKDGRVHVAMANNAWKLKLPQDERGFFYASLAPGAKAFGPTRNLNRKPSEGFSLAADAQGNVTAFFLSGKLYSMVSHDNGQTFGSYTEPNPAWNPCNCCTTAAAYGADGKLALLYREETNDERDMFVGLLGGGGKAGPTRARVSETRWKLSACPMTYFAISGAGDGFVAAWPTKTQVYFTRLDKTGKAWPAGEIKTPGTSGMRNGLVALSAGDGATLIAWKNKDVLGWQLYDTKGQPTGEPGSATSPGSGAAGVVLSDGSFILFL